MVSKQIQRNTDGNANLRSTHKTTANDANKEMDPPNAIVVHRNGECLDPQHTNKHDGTTMNATHSTECR